MPAGLERQADGRSEPAVLSQGELHDLGRRVKLDLGVTPQLLLQEWGSLEVRGGRQDADPRGELREEERLLRRQVPLAHDDELLGPAVEGTVAARAEVDAGPAQLLLTGNPELPMPDPRCDDGRAGSGFPPPARRAPRSAPQGRRRR